MCRLLSWLGHEGRFDLALAVFEWLDSRPEYTTADRFLYTRLLSMSARQPNGAVKALEIFDRMCTARIRPDVVAFNAGIGAAGAIGPAPMFLLKLSVRLGYSICFCNLPYSCLILKPSSSPSCE